MSEPPSEKFAPLVAVIMGSRSDWETMREAARILTEFEVPHESRVISAHRTPDLMAEFAVEAEGARRVLHAHAGADAHVVRHDGAVYLVTTHVW